MTVRKEKGEKVPFYAQLRVARSSSLPQIHWGSEGQRTDRTGRADVLGLCMLGLDDLLVLFY